jgi:hypothetical protein
MISDVQISLTADDGDDKLDLQKKLENLGISGASVSYGINRLPIAQIQVDPKGLKSFCDFDQYRRKPVTLNIRTSNYLKGGCLQFKGMIDGVSITQQSGILNTSLILKHRFTLLNEIYPRFMGMSTGSANMFSMQYPIKYNKAAFSELSTTNKFLTTDLKLYGYANKKIVIKTTQTIIPFIIEILKAVIKFQLISTRPQVNLDSKYRYISNALKAVIEAQQINEKNIQPIIEQLMENIDTTYSAGMQLRPGDRLNAGSPPLVSNIIADIGSLDDTIYSSMIRLIGQYGCVFVVANNKAFIIPEISFLKVGRYTGEDEINIAYPSDYESFSFNDSGENTIKGVYVVPDPMGIQGSWNVGGTNTLTGKFIDGPLKEGDKKVFGNIVVKTLPQFASTYVVHMGALGSAGIQTNIAMGNNLISFVMHTADVIKSVVAHSIAVENQIKNVQSFLNSWAQMEYCRLKYEDRTGSISMPYNNRWVPGAPGSLYTNHPGTYVDFFVTEVTHSFSLQTPATGHASTQVSFKGGRPGDSAIQAGLDKMDLYDYGYEDALNFCYDFLADLKPDEK